MDSLPVIPAESPDAKPWLRVQGSRFLVNWLEESDVSLAFSTYQTGKLFFLGHSPQGDLSLFERSFPYCMGLWASQGGENLWLASRYQVWKLSRCQGVHQQGLESPSGAAASAGPGWLQSPHDCLYVPRCSYITGHLDIHDIALDSNGRLIFANTLFSCLATLSEDASFSPLWTPPFISKLAAEDRCHLNGLAISDGRPAFATALSASDAVDGWRSHRQRGGVVLNVQTNDVAASGLSMPHSPRWNNGKLWVLNSGTGHLGYICGNTGRFEPVAFCRGYLRGLSFCGNYAIVTVSQPRHESFHGLQLDDELRKRNVTPACGINIIDVRSGSVEHWCELKSDLLTELYDVVVLPGVRQPKAIGIQSSDIEKMLSIGPLQQLNPGRSSCASNS